MNAPVLRERHRPVTILRKPTPISQRTSSNRHRTQSASGIPLHPQTEGVSRYAREVVR